MKRAVLFILSISIKLLIGQSIVDTIYISDDAVISNYTTSKNNNYGNVDYISPWAWTSSGLPWVQRTFIKIPVDSIPSNAIINSAKLHLKGNGHNPSTQPNSIFVYYVTQNWLESTLTWNNQPSVNTSYFASLPTTTSSNQNDSIDLQGYINIALNYPDSIFGISTRLQNEIHYTKRYYGSSENSNSLLRPFIVVNYDLPSTPTIENKILVGKIDNLFTYKIMLNGGTPPYKVYIDSISNVELKIDSLVAEIDSNLIPFGLDSLSYKLKNSLIFYDSTTVQLKAGHHYLYVVDSNDSTVTDTIFCYDSFGLDSSLITLDSANYLENVNGNNWVNSYGLLSNYVTSREYSELVLEDFGQSSNFYVGYRSLSDSIITDSIEDVLYGYFLYNNQLFTIVNGSVSEEIENFNPTNVYKISILNDSVTFSENNEIIDQCLRTSNTSIVLKTAIRQLGKLDPIKLSINNWGKTKPNGLSVEHLDCLSNSNGLLNYFNGFDNDIKEEISSPTYYYFTDPNNQNSSPFPLNYIPTNVGVYTLNVPPSISYSFNVGYAVNWPILSNGVITPSNEKNSPTVSNVQNLPLFVSTNYHAYSLNTIPANSNGWIEFDVASCYNQNESQFELIHIKNHYNFSNGYFALGVLYNGSGKYSLLSSNGTSMFLKDVNVGDRITVNINANNTIDFYKNGNLFYFNSPTNTALSLNGLNSSVLDFRLIFSQDNGKLMKNFNTSYPCNSNMPFVDLKSNIDDSYFLAIGKKIKFNYIEEYNTNGSNLNYKILGIGGLDITSSVNPTLNNNIVNYGWNQYEMQLGSIASGIYLLEVENVKSEKWYLKFLVP